MTPKADNFIRLSTSRVDNILNAIRVFGNLSSPNYEWTPEQVQDLFRQIDEARDEAFNKFAGRNPQLVRPSEPVDPVNPVEDDPEPEPVTRTPRQLSFYDILKEVETEAYQLEEANEIIAMYRKTYPCSSKTPSTT